MGVTSFVEVALQSENLDLQNARLKFGEIIIVNTENEKYLSFTSQILSVL